MKKTKTITRFKDRLKPYQIIASDFDEMVEYMEWNRNMIKNLVYYVIVAIIIGLIGVFVI